MTLSESGSFYSIEDIFFPLSWIFLGVSKETVYACTQETWLTHSISLVQSHQSDYLFPLTQCLRIAQQPWSGFVIFPSFGSDQQVKHAFCDTAGFLICHGSCRQMRCQHFAAGELLSDEQWGKLVLLGTILLTVYSVQRFGKP